MSWIKYNTKLFTEVWDEESKFEADYKASELYQQPTTVVVGGVSKTNYHNSLSNDNIKVLYYMLYARYGNNPIANLDENQFKYKVYSIIFQYGPKWQKELEVQDILRGLDETQLIQGAKTIYNKAYNDATAPSTQTMEETPYINEQNVSNYKKNKLGAYAELLSLLKTNVSDVFLDRFRKLFKTVVAPDHPTLFVTDIEEDEDND